MFANLLIILFVTNIMDADKQMDNKQTADGVPSKKKYETEDAGIVDSSENGGKEFADDPSFPKTLTEFGYQFNGDGELRHIETNRPFNFNVREGDHIYNQRHYEALGDVITDHVFHLLESETQLNKVEIPIDATESEPRTFFYASDDVLSNPDKLLILIHGSGVVRAGQWSRRLIINDRLESGAQILFIKRAKDEDYGIVVLNTNDNHGIIGDKTVAIRGSERPEHHIRYVWDHFVRNSKAKHISVIAHSYGGIAFVDLAIRRFHEVKSRIVAVAFTDSVHNLMMQRCPNEVAGWLRRIGCNWVTSNEPLDTPVIGRRVGEDVPCVSAGHIKHEMTSWSSFSSIFTFLSRKMEEVKHPPEVEHKEL